MNINLIINFLIGGITVSGTSYLGTFLSPVHGAIFWSYPFTIIPTIYFMKLSNKENEYISHFIISSALAFIILISTLIFMSNVIKDTNDNENIIIPIIYSTIFWIVISIIFFYVYIYFFKNIINKKYLL